MAQGTQVKSLKAAKKSFKATWSRQKTQVSGYQLQYARNKSFKSSVKTSTISNNKTVSKTVTKLTAKKTYYVRVRTYKNVKVNGKTTVTAKGKVTAKKAGKGKTVKITAKATDGSGIKKTIKIKIK